MLYPLRSITRQTAAIFFEGGRSGRWYKPNFSSSILALIFLSTSIIFSKLSKYSWFQFPLDDAWIHRVYSRSFAAGRGFQYNWGEQEAGSTSPLWCIITAPAHFYEWIDINVPPFLVKCIGIALAISSIVLIEKIGTGAFGSKTTGFIASLLFCLEPKLHYSALSGMETVLVLALNVGLIYSILQRKWIYVAILVGLLPVSRPETLIFIPVVLLWLFIWFASNGLLKRLSFFAISILPAAGWSLFCKTVSNHWLPNTYYLKAASFRLTEENLIVAWKAISESGFAATSLFSVGMVLFVISSSLRKNLFNTISLLLFLVLNYVYILSVVSTRYIVIDAYYWTRWIDPATLTLTLCSSLGFATLFATKRPITGTIVHKNIYGLRSWVTICAALLLILTGPQLLKSFDKTSDRLISDSRAIYKINVSPAIWIKKHSKTSDIVGVNDAGAMRYFGQRKTIDLLGLNNHELAFKKKDPKDYYSTMTWLAIFPSWFNEETINNNYRLVKYFDIPLKEYTVCDCPGQTKMEIYKKR